MSSKASRRRSASVSPGSGGSTSANIGTITSGQPWRMSDSVPSKSKSTWLMPGRGAKRRAKNHLAAELGLHRGESPSVRGAVHRSIIFSIVS